MAEVQANTLNRERRRPDTLARFAIVCTAPYGSGRGVDHARRQPLAEYSGTDYVVNVPPLVLPGRCQHSWKPDSEKEEILASRRRMAGLSGWSGINSELSPAPPRRR